MNIAFFAPLKPPDHPVPSGDRAFARALVQAMEIGGCTISLPSTLRLYEGAGDSDAQTQLHAAATAEVDKILSMPVAGSWQAWVTYHNYYKAPDLIGPKVSQALDIPYIQVETTRAKKRLSGPWARFAAAAEAATDKAKLVFYLTERDAEALLRDAPAGQQLVHLRPFLASTTLPDQSNLSGAILAVGMMRHGDKLASYQLIADTLGLMPDLDWRLTIVGDGEARGAVETMMSPFRDRVTFAGALTSDALAQIYGQASMLFWPGVNEAFGMVYLEAQAAGLPVVAQDRPGVRDVLRPAPHPRPHEGAAALVTRLVALLESPAQRQTEGSENRFHIARAHLIETASKTLVRSIKALT